MSTLWRAGFGSRVEWLRRWPAIGLRDGIGFMAVPE